MNILYVVPSVEMIGLRILEYHHVWIVELHINTFCNVFRILRETESLPLVNTEWEQPWLGEDIYIYACVMVYMNSKNSAFWDFIVLNM
jgi:hypothetical protein